MSRELLIEQVKFFISGFFIYNTFCIDESKLCKGTGRKLKKLGTKFDNRADVVVLGKLEEGMNGHMGAYPLRFTISCVEKYKKIY